MKRTLATLLPFLALAVIAIGCGDKKTSGPVSVKKFDAYNDDILKFSVRYPAEWTTKGVQPGVQAVFYSSPSITDGFTTYTPGGQLGAKIDVHSMTGGQAAMDTSIADLKRPFTANVFSAPEQITLNGQPATKLSYTFDVDETKFKAERYYVMVGDVVTYLETAVVGNYADYAAVFDSARASFKPGTAGTVSSAPVDTSAGAPAAKDSDLVEPPATTMKPYSNSYFSMQIPSNFSPGTTRAGGALSSTNFAGARNDSYIQIDVIDAKDLTLQQIVDQNKKNYGGRPASAATVGNLHGSVFNYTGGRDVSSRAYFLTAGKRLFRITVNWFTPQKDLYLPAFEKSLGSFQGH